MLKLRQLNLQLAFARAGALREDVENQRRAVENFAVEDFFEVAALRGRKIVVKNHGVHVLPPTEIREFSRLALADERGRIQRFCFLPAVAHDFAARRCGQFTKFGERIAHVRMVARFEFDADEEDPFRPRFSGFNERFQSLAEGIISRTGAFTVKNCDDVRPHPGPLPSVFATLRRDRAEAEGEGGRERGNCSPRFEQCVVQCCCTSHFKWHGIGDGNKVREIVWQRDGTLPLPGREGPG